MKLDAHEQQIPTAQPENEKTTKAVFKPLEPYTKLTFCGGLREVGKNMCCIESGNELYIIDCGMKMTKNNEYGYRIIIPSFDYVIRNAKKVKGIIITHGHEDHIGAIPYLLEHFPDITIYIPNLAREILLRKLNQSLRSEVKLITINENFVLKTAEFEFSFYITVHSIPDSYGIIASSPDGIVIFSGDFRIDFTPLGKITEFEKLTAVQDKCDLVLSDSTNSLVEKFSTTERVIIDNLENIFKKAKGRLIVTAFASNVYRVQYLIKLAIKYQRRIFLVGTSMKNIARIAVRGKYFNFGSVAKGLFLDSKGFNSQPPQKVLILCTGSQGESQAALTRMSVLQSRDLKPVSTDTIVFSSNAIPGNYWQVQQIVNNLQRFGSKIIQSSQKVPIHTSGHASREEQKLFLALLKPKAFIPIHGELNMLTEHIETAIKMGVPREKTFRCKNGSAVALQKHNTFWLQNETPMLCRYVDGTNLVSEEMNKSVLGARRMMINSGFVIAVVAINLPKWESFSNVSVIIRGAFYTRNNMRLIIMLQRSLSTMLHAYFKEPRGANTTDNKILWKIHEMMTDAVRKYIYKYKRINPLVRTVVLTELPKSLVD